MITGHFTTALVPYGRHKKYPLFVLLLLTQVQDLLIPVDMMLQKVGLFDLGILEMTYSHDIVPALIMSVVAAIIIQLIYKDIGLTAWAAFLVVFHEICDLIAGFSHNIMGLDSHRMGFDLYRQNAPLAVVIEAILATLCLIYFLRKRKKEGEPLKGMKLVGLLCMIYVPMTLFMGLSVSGQLF